MKKKSIDIGLVLVMLIFAVTTQAAEISGSVPNPLTSVYTVGSGDYFQSAGLTLDINSGGTLAVTDPTYEAIIQQNAAGTSTITINTGGTMSFSGANTNGRRLFIGNNVAGAIGIINLNGGTFDGSGLTTAGETVIGRDGAQGYFNISAGTATFGSLPVFGSGGGTGRIDFTAGSTGSLTITGADIAYYQGLYAAGNLTYDGSNTSDFDDVFFVTGQTITVDLSDRRVAVDPVQLTISEGRSDSYEVRLQWTAGAEPTDDVEVTVTPGAKGEYLSLNSNPAGQAVTLTFTSATGYDTPQTVTLLAIDDEVDTGTKTVVIAHSVVSDDSDWEVLAVPDMTVLIDDDDRVINNFELRYNEPATDWQQQALPVGNGRLGGMIFGGVPREHIQFNEDSLWRGDDNPSGAWNPPDGGMGAYQNFGDIYIDFDNQSSYSNYQRKLDLTEAVHTVTYTSGGINYTRETFSSNEAQVLLVRLTADQAGSYSGLVTLQDAHSAATTVSGNKLTASGSLTNGLQYESQMLVLNTGGSQSADGSGIRFTNADSVTLLLAADTDYLADYSADYRGAHPSSQLASQLSSASARSYSELRSEHVAGYQNLYNRVSLDLNTDPAIDALDTDVRLTNYKSGTVDRGLEALLFQYGRYMLISCSRPGNGALPSNLQGLWNNDNDPAWASDYHSNINTQMFYWPAETTNLAECHTVLHDYIISQAPAWRAPSNTAFAARGWTVRTSSNIFGGMAWNWNKPGNAWYAMHFWEHYAFGLDQNYLNEVAYPLLKELCEFWQDELVEVDHPEFSGTMVLVSPNDWSPEHGPWEDGPSYAQQCVYNLFTNYIEASTVLDIDAAFRAEVADMKSRLLEPRIGSWGQLREWMDTNDIETDTHRHLSHLIAAYPGSQITLDETPALAEAVRTSLVARGDGGPGWSVGWKISLWARLRDGNKAHQIIGEQLKNTIYSNLFNVHPPFQIDGNFGATAGVAEMLIQSHNGVVHLLPALPFSWPDGDVTGLCARGGLEVDMKWADGQLTLATIRPKKDGVYNLRYGTVEVVLDATAGEVYYWNGQWKNDLNFNGKIDLIDFSMIAQEWLRVDCGESNNWCLGKDVNRDHKVDKDDLVSICQGWLNELVLE